MANQNSKHLSCLLNMSKFANPRTQCHPAVTTVTNSDRANSSPLTLECGQILLIRCPKKKNKLQIWITTAPKPVWYRLHIPHHPTRTKYNKTNMLVTGRHASMEPRELTSIGKGEPRVRYNKNVCFISPCASLRGLCRGRSLLLSVVTSWALARI